MRRAKVPLADIMQVGSAPISEVYGPVSPRGGGIPNVYERPIMIHLTTN
jgi:hypothetical protein